MATKTTRVTTTSTTARDSGSFTGQTWVESGAAGANVYSIQDTATTAKLSLRGSGDKIYVEAFSSEFQVKASGKTVYLKSDTQTITIALASVSKTNVVADTIYFLDGSLSVGNSANSTALKLGTQSLTAKYADLAVEATDSDTASDFFSGDSTGSDLALTTSADDLNGTDANDTFSGGAGRLTAGDDIDGNGGTDTLDVSVTSGALDLSISEVENIKIKVLSSTATYNFAAVDTAVSYIQITGTGNADLDNLDDAESVVLADGYARTLKLQGVLADTTADAVNIKLNDAGSAYLYTSGIENVNIYSLGSANDVTVMDFDSVANINLAGDKDITLRMASAYATSGFSGADAQITFETTIDSIGATGLSANLTLYVGFSAASGMAVNGGTGADTFTFASGYLPTNVTIDGGAGSDTLNAEMTATTWLARVTNVETFGLDIASGGGVHTANFNLATTLTTLNLNNVASAAVFSALYTTVKTINVYDETDATGNLTFDLKSGSTTLAFNISEVSSAATGVGVGNITIGTVDSVTLTNAGKSSANFLGNLTVNSAHTLAMNISSDLALSALAASEADTITITSTGDLKVSNTTTFATANTVTIDYTQAATAVGTGFAMSAVSLGAANATAGEFVTVALNVRGSTTAGSVLIADLSAASLVELGISAQNADVTITSLEFGQTANSNSSNVNVVLNLNAVNTGDDIAIRTLGASTAAGLSWQSGNGSLTINALGHGNVSLGTANGFQTAASGNTAAVVNATGLDGTFTFFATGSTGLAFNITLGNDVASANLIKLGEGADSVLGGANADTIWAGAGADTVDGNGGADVIYGQAGADEIVGGAGAATIDGGAGDDTIDFSQGTNYIINAGLVAGSGAANGTLGGAGDDVVSGWGSGDTIKFTAAPSVLNSAANGAAATGIATGSFVYFTAAAGYGTAASGSELNVAIYQNGSDTIIHFNVATATAAAGTGQTITLQNVTGWTSLTAAFKVSFGASGLYIIGL